MITVDVNMDLSSFQISFELSLALEVDPNHKIKNMQHIKYFFVSL